MPRPEEARRRVLSPFLTTDEFRPLSSTVRVDIAARSHRGVARPHNEDHFLLVRLSRRQETLATSLPEADIPRDFEESAYVMLVADGLGHDGAGSLAGRIAISTIAHLAVHHGQWTLRVDPKTAEEMFERAEWYYGRAGAAIAAKSRTHPELSGMATALTAAYSAGGDLLLAHVGHTRAYLYRHGALKRLTIDHTLEEHLAKDAPPPAEDGSAGDLRHILTEAVGIRGGEPVVDLDQLTLVDGDAVLLCTNGLTDMVSDERIAEVLSMRRRSDDQCQTLVDMANEAGGKDNITVLLAQYRIPRE